MQIPGALKFFYLHGTIFQPLRSPFIKSYMLQSSRYALSVLGLLLGGQAALAQQTTPAGTPSPGWYVGAQASNELRNYHVGRQGNGLFTWNLGIYGGYAVSSRLALQLGLGYGRGNKPNEEQQGSGQYAYYPQTEQITQAWTVPAQVHWSFAKNPHRFQVAGVAGVSLCFFRQRATGNNTATGMKYVIVQKGFNGYVDLGVEGRLQLNTHIALVLGLLTNVNMVRASNSYLPISPGFGSSLGLRYALR